MTVFGMPGMAGKVGTDLTPEIALSIGRALGMRYRSAVVSRDARHSGVMISNALASGLCSVGCSVTDIGICPLPVSVKTIKDGGCGVMVTAPDSPPEYNGIRFGNSDGSAFTDVQTEEIRNAAECDGMITYAKHDAVGRISEDGIPAAAYMKVITDAVGTIDCPVIVDCASDSAALVTPALLAGMGADVTTANSNIGMNFFGRHPEPSETNLRDLMKHVRSEPGSIGIAHDGSGSRVAVIDESGRYLSGNTLIMLLASYIKADSAVVPVNATMAVEEIVRGKVIRTNVGDRYISDAMKKNGIQFGGEPSGSFVFGNVSMCPDGIHAAALIAGIASEGSLRQTVDELPRYPTGSGEVRFSCDREDIVKRIDEKLSSAEYGSLIRTDGWRVEMDNGWYFVRLSDTGNRVMITAEARDRAYMSCLLEMAQDAVASCIR